MVASPADVGASDEKTAEEEDGLFDAVDAVVSGVESAGTPDTSIQDGSDFGDEDSSASSTTSPASSPPAAGAGDRVAYHPNREDIIAQLERWLMDPGFVAAAIAAQEEASVMRGSGVSTAALAADVGKSMFNAGLLAAGLPQSLRERGSIIGSGVLVGRKVYGDPNVPSGQLTFAVPLRSSAVVDVDSRIRKPVMTYFHGHRPATRVVPRDKVVLWWVTALAFARSTLLMHAQPPPCPPQRLPLTVGPTVLVLIVVHV
jgi:hypothetical protein